MRRVEEVISSASMSKGDIDQIILVGGSSRIPKIHEMLESYFGKKPICDWIHPEESIAYGAAVYGANIKGLRDTAAKNVRLPHIGVLISHFTLNSRNRSRGFTDC